MSTIFDKAAVVPVPRRRWGRSEILIPTVCFGAIGISGYFGEISDNDAIALIRRSIWLGVDHIDCSPCYGYSLGKIALALAGLPRDSFIISGRVCPHIEDAPDPLRPTADAALESVKRQLDFLGIDAFDAVFVHDPDDPVAALGPDGSLDGLLAAKSLGLTRAIGLATRSHAAHRRALATGEVDVMLTYDDFNLLRQTAALRGGLLDEAASRDVGVLNGRVLLRGLLAGGDVEAAAQRGDWSDRADILRAQKLRTWASNLGVDLLAVALQFCLRDGRVHSNAVAMQCLEELELNVAALGQPLSVGIWDRLWEAEL